MGRRILSLHLPRLASDLAARHSGRGEGPLAIIARQGRGDVLACLSPAAQAQGLRRGQPLSEARALVPDLATLPLDPAAMARALDALRRWALRYAPWVAAEGEDGLVIDLTGSAHLMGGEGLLADDLMHRLAAMGFEARLAVAPTQGAAWALARFAPGPVTLAEEAREAIGPLPMAALRLAPETVAALARLGLRQVRDLTRAPRGALARRFGADVMLRLDQANGALAEPVAAPPVAAPHAVRLSLPEPIGLAADVMAGLARLLERLCQRLAAEALGARRLRLELRRADGTMTQAEIALARPMRDPAAMAALFARPIDSLDAGFGFDALRLSAPLVEALVPAQLAGDGRASGADALADLLTRLGNRVGLDSLIRFLPADSHIPERAFQIASAVHAGAPGAGAWPLGPERPLLLFPPEPLAGLTGAMPPRQLRWRRRVLSVVRALGPERLAPEWWLDDPAWRSGMRDYWRLDCAEGPRLWAFFTPQAPGWAVQGVFA